MTSSTVSDLAFLERVSEEAQTADYARFAEQSATRQHPPADQLYDYAAGEIDESLAPAVRDHLAFCSECSREALRLMQVSDELEHEALDWANVPASSITETSQQALSESIDATLGAVKTLGERAMLWVSELWQPQWAGQFVTAADVPEQHQTFTSEHGDIHLTCYWHDDSTNEPAILSIAWQADLIKEDRLWLRFMDPKAQDVRQEIFLGARAVGEEQFTIQDLNFDFVRDQWAIALALEASSS